MQLTPGSDGKYEIHQKTNGNYDDVNPIYVPGGLIAFVTNEMYTAMGTRADEYEHSRAALQLATISVDGGDADRHILAQNLSHTVTPFLRYDGRIGFSQWEHFASTNDVKLRAVNPDGTQQVGIAGEFDGAQNDQGQGKPGDALFSVHEISAERDGRHRHRARPHHPRRRARQDRRAQHGRPRVHGRPVGLHQRRGRRPRSASTTRTSTTPC